MKTDIKRFIAALLENNYKLAQTHLKSAVNKKIKQQIINNNTTLF
jgi:hypothetical protein